MIMENANGGELFDYIVRHTRLAEKQAAKFYCELIAGIEYLVKKLLSQNEEDVLA